MLPSPTFVRNSFLYPPLTLIAALHLPSSQASASSPVRHVARVARCSRRGFALSGDWSVLAALRYEALGAEVPLHAELLRLGDAELLACRVVEVGGHWFES